VTISLPHLVGSEGILASFPLPLDEAEQAAMEASAEVVCQAIEELDADQDV
jgi:malate/lactate dehydrogenase